MNKKEEEIICPMQQTLKIINGKWKSLILQQLENDLKRFNELHKLLTGVTKQMLSKNLKELEEDGVISRKIYPTVPPKVEYSLTEKGHSLIPILKTMEDWAKDSKE